jgi:thiol:disulfide interchange protein DsbD
MRLKRILLLLLAALPVAGQRAPKLDPEADVSVAFRKGAVVVQAPEGAHLKAQFMEVKLAEGTPGAKPQGKLIVGPLPKPNGKDELDEGIWHGSVRIPVKGEGLAGAVELEVTYQPCTEGEGGVCYPPTHQRLTVKASEIPASAVASDATQTPIAAPMAPPSLTPVQAPIPAPSGVATSEAAPAPESPAAPAPSKSLFWLFLGIFGAGVIASLTPCVYPMIPITLAVIGAKGGGKAKGLKLSITLVLGMAATYTVLGVIAARTGAAFGAFVQHPSFLVPVSVIFALFALSLFGAFEIQLPEGLRNRLQGGSPKGGYLGAFTVGLLLGPLSAPCVGPIVGSILLMIGQQGQVILGALQLFTFALGMGVLFIAVGTSSAALPRSGDWLLKVKQAMGVIVLGFAAWNVRLVVPAWMNPAMWSLTLLALAATLDAFRPAEGFAPSLRKGLGLLSLAVALLLGVRAVEAGLGIELLPQKAATARIAVASEPSASAWISQDLEGALARAKAQQKVVLVDAYADWCAQCKELDEKTWPDAAVGEWIARHAVAVRVNGDKDRKDLAARFHFSGYPTVLLLDANGRELRRAMGFRKPEEMLRFLNGQ